MTIDTFADEMQKAYELVKEKGYIPMLYTDADFIASNAYYEKIGYILRGKLCTIGQ